MDISQRSTPLKVGNAMHLGTGRKTTDDIIDLAVGVAIDKKVGDWVTPDTIIGEVYSNTPLDEHDPINSVTSSPLVNRSSRKTAHHRYRLLKILAYKTYFVS